MKINDQIFLQIQKTLFLALFPNFGAKIFFAKILTLSHTTWWRILASCHNSEKPNDLNPRKQPDWQQDWRMNRSYFMGPFDSYHYGSNKYNCSRLTFETYDVGLTKNYCMTVSMQKISSIHKLILMIHQILGSHKLSGHAHFWPCSP